MRSMSEISDKTGSFKMSFGSGKMFVYSGDTGSITRVNDDGLLVVN